MSDDSLDDDAKTAIEQLEALGLSAYAARTFVALIRLGDGTAKEIHETSGVPRTRVYDAAEELRTHGLVDVQQSSPQRFWAISTETTGKHFEREYDYRVNQLTDALDSLAATEHSVEQRGVWTVTGRDTIDERIADFVDSAEREVVYMSVEDLLTEEVSESLSRASDRDVSIKLAGMSSATEHRLQDHIPAAEEFESLWDWSDTPAGRLLMVDQKKTLVSVLVRGADEHQPYPRDETAIWGEGRTNGLVVVLQAMFTWQLDDARR